MIRVARRLKAVDVIDVFTDLFILCGVPGHIRSDQGPEFIATAVKDWIAAVGAKTAYWCDADSSYLRSGSYRRPASVRSTPQSCTFCLHMTTRALLEMGYDPEEVLTASHKGSKMVALQSTIGKAASLSIGTVGYGAVPYVKPASSDPGTVP